MKNPPIATVTLIVLGLTLAACGSQQQLSQTANNPSTAAPTPTPEEVTAISLSAIDALLADYSFVLELKKKAQLSDTEIANLKKLSSAEVKKLQSASSGNQSPAADDPRARALKAVRDLLGKEKADQVFTLAREQWKKGNDNSVVSTDLGPTLLPGPNAVPPDTRIVVNIPAFRMDLFSAGKLLKSWRIGIGYQEYPLPTGFRKAEAIIFNPTWTQPNEPWATSPGSIVPAGAAGNPLGPIKVPIGGANLIHGGKALAKIGTFASHGCVGLTNEQVRDFAKVLADGTSTELRDETISAYLRVRTRTQVVKLTTVVPVELRYETIVIQDGQLHVYRDVYNKNTNTEENLRATFEANGLNFENLPEEERVRAIEAVNAMSLRPKKLPTPKPTPTVAGDQNSLSRLKSQKEIIVDIASLSGKGYPAPKDLNTGASTARLGTTMDTAPRPEPTRRPSPKPSATAESSPATIRPSPAPATSVPSPTQPRPIPPPAPQITPDVRRQN